MQRKKIIGELDRNGKVFESMLLGMPQERYRWRPGPTHWCLLEIVCHLGDEEREDFRARLAHVLEKPHTSMPAINPSKWVVERNYMDQDYDEKVEEFLLERKKSVEWLESLTLDSDKWSNVYEHEQLGSMSADLFLSNWLAHDLLHIRQITRLKYFYLKKVLSDESLDYAGRW